MASTNANKQTKAEKAAAKLAQANLHAPAAATEAAAPTPAPTDAPTLAPTEAPAAAPSQGDAAMNFSAQQLAVPEAPAAAPSAAAIAAVDVNSPEFKAALAQALANRVPVTKKSAEPKAPRAKRVEQNGVKRPLPGTGICAQMWAKMDEITATQMSPCTIAQVRAALPHFNQVNLQGEYASWRKFNGITGRIVAPVQVTVDPVAIAAQTVANAAAETAPTEAPTEAPTAAPEAPAA